MKSYFSKGGVARFWLVLSAAVLVFAGGAVARDVASRYNVKARLSNLKMRLTGEEAPEADPSIRTALQTVILTRQNIPNLKDSGGAIEEIEGFIVLATPHGELGYLKPGKDIRTSRRRSR